MMNNIDRNNIFNKKSLSTSKSDKKFLYFIHHNTQLINEDGLFEAILSSQKKEARIFKKKIIVAISKSTNKCNKNYEENKDLWLNITPVAKKFNKRIDNFWRDEDEYVKEIENLTPWISGS